MTRIRAAPHPVYDTDYNIALVIGFAYYILNIILIYSLCTLLYYILVGETQKPRKYEPARTSVDPPNV